MEIYKYTVEFQQKPYVKMGKTNIVRPITDSLLQEFLNAVESRSKTYKPHQNLFGMADNGRIRYVHFFSNLNFGEVHSIAKKYAEEHRYNFTAKGFSIAPKTPVMKSGGLINFLTKKVTFSDLKKF